MDQYRINKLKEQVEIQSRLKGKDSESIARYLELNTDWSINFNYEKIVYNYLERNGLLRSQVQKSCKIRDGVKIL